MPRTALKARQAAWRDKPPGARLAYFALESASIDTGDKAVYNMSNSLSTPNTKADPNTAPQQVGERGRKE
jgi:hypothetical protein